jgi:hypothetical protein
MTTQGYIEPDLPDRIRLVDSENFLSVDLHKMILAGDGGTRILKLTERSRWLQPQTAFSLQYVALHALNGRRKVGTVVRWLNEFNLFLQTIRTHVTVSIATITFKMFNWYVATKNASQHKLLRSFLLYWIRTKQPGISEELTDYLAISSPPQPRSQIAIQNAEPHERPFNVGETRQILAAVDRLFISQVFDAQDNLLWRLIIAEGLRPTQLRLLTVGDVTLHVAGEASTTVLLRVPCIKQHGNSGRSHMMETSMPNSVGVALRLHLVFLERVLGHPPAKTSPMFAVSHAAKGQPLVRGTPISIDERIVLTRPRIADMVPFLKDHDLFTRRFKHTKLTHLAILGAPLEVLARAGYQTSTISLRHYVNLSQEAFVDYEERMTSEHTMIRNAFGGSLITAEDATHPDLAHKIFDSNLDDTVGSCATDPCDVFAPVGCYTCPRFEAFTDGAHGTVLSFLTKQKERARQMGLSAEAISRDDASISAVQQVIDAVARANNRA